MRVTDTYPATYLLPIVALPANTDVIVNQIQRGVIIETQNKTVT